MCEAVTLQRQKVVGVPKGRRNQYHGYVTGLHRYTQLQRELGEGDDGIGWKTLKYIRQKNNC